MPYLIRCARGNIALAITYRGVLSALRDVGPDAAVFNLFGRWVAGRKVMP